VNVVDSSGWLAYFANDAHTDYFAEPIEQVDELIVPTLSRRRAKSQSVSTLDAK
jgi:hypothetical protein